MEVGGRSSSSDHGHGGGMNMGEGFSSISMRMNMMMPPPPPPPLMPSPPPLPNNNPPYCLEMNTLFPPPPLSSSSNNNNMAFYNDNKNRIKQNPQVAAPGNCYFMMINNNNTTTTTSTSDQNNNNNNDSCSLLMRAKIMAHPHYPRLLAAYINCHKVGAPPEVVKRLDEILSADKVNRSRSSSTGGGGGVLLGEDPSLDQFMEAYSEMLIKYEQQLTKPLQEAMLFLSSLHSQLKTLDTPLTNSPPPPPPPHSSSGQNGSSDGEIDANNNDNYIDPQAEDRELKLQLLRKYSGCLGSLKQEFMKKRKKGKLPKEAREQLLDWWSRHYKWPYPSESQKMALAETTGLDQKQINNWFINQRKRHWKPSEEMQFVELDGSNHPHHQYYIENVLNNNPYYMDYYTQPSLL